MGNPTEQKHPVRSDVWPQLMRALELDTAGKLGEADELYRAVLAIDPTNFAALNRRAVLSAMRGDLVEALRLIQAASAANPNLGHIAVDMGNILARMGRIEEAIRLERESIRREVRFIRENIGREANTIRTSIIDFPTREVSHRPFDLKPIQNGYGRTSCLSGCHPGIFAAWVYCYANRIGLRFTAKTCDLV